MNHYHQPAMYPYSTVYQHPLHGQLPFTNSSPDYLYTNVSPCCPPQQTTFSPYLYPSFAGHPMHHGYSVPYYPEYSLVAPHDSVLPVYPYNPPPQAQVEVPPGKVQVTVPSPVISL